MNIVIIGGGPGGYEAALVAAELGADVTVVNDEGLGGNCVLWDCVPSKTLLSSAQAFSTLETAPALGVHVQGVPRRAVPTYEGDLATIMDRVRDLANAQSEDIRKRVVAEGARSVKGTGRIVDPHVVEVRDGSRLVERLDCDAILIATGSGPRRLSTAPTDGEVILSSRDVYSLKEVPERLVVIGAGATGAEYATAFLRFGSKVTFVVSRDRVLPAIGQVPQTSGLGLEEVGVRLDGNGGVTVDGVSRTTVPNIYAAGDVTGKLMLASVAAMQGRIAMWHLLGQAVSPLRWDAVAATIFTDPQIATVGLSEQRAARANIEVVTERLPLSSNSRAKMSNQGDGFVKLLARPGSGTIVGGAVVAGYASDLIAPVSLACFNRVTASQLSQAFQIYPSFAGSVQECARLLAGRVQGGYRY